MLIESIKNRAINLRDRVIYSALTSKPAHDLLEASVSVFARPLQTDPQNETMLGRLNILDKIGRVFLPDDKRVFESKITDSLRRDLQVETTDGVDTNSVAKSKRLLSLMGERYLSKALLDFVVVNFGFGTLKERLLAQEGKPSIHYLAMQVNSECNANPRCQGCFAEGNTSKLSDEILDRVQSEAISLGSRITIILGGEPLLEKDRLLKFFGKYNRMPFLVATNGILVDDAYAAEVADLGNVITFINTPGLEDTTNQIRNNNAAWRHIEKAAKSLKKYRAAAGFATTVYRNNYLEVSSEAFTQKMIDLDMMLGFYLGYTDPLGCPPKEDLALTPEMNEEFSGRVKDISSKKPLYVIDTTGGRESILGGCPAGRLALVYIQSNGRVTGCPMAPQNDDSMNVSNRLLSEILTTPFFEGIRKERPSCLKSSKFWSVN